MNRKIKVVLLEPNKLARIKEIDASLEGMQKVVGGLIEPAYYFDDPVCMVVNEEGKLTGLELNRGILNSDGELIDIIAGTSFICGRSDDRFESLSDEMAQKYIKIFKYPHLFYRINGEIVCSKYYISDEE